MSSLKNQTCILLNLFFIVSFVISAQSVFSQNMSQGQWNTIRDEAYLNFIQNGGTTQQWQYNSDQIAQDYYKRIYTYSNSGEVQRKQSYVAGTFVGANGPMGSFNNGYVLNSMGQTMGYWSQGSFLNSQGQCVGIVRGNQILTCNGGLLATINSNGVYDAQGYVIYAIKGETLYSQNYPVLQIAGMDIYSLAAYLLFY